MANVLGALVAGVVRVWLVNQDLDEGMPTAFYVIDRIVGGVLYAAVTGAALLVLAGRTSGAQAESSLVGNV